MTHTPPLTIRRTEEPLPPLYAIRCVRWPAAMRAATAAEYLDVSETHFRTHVAPELTPVSLGGRAIGYARADLDAWLDRRPGAAPASDANPWDAPPRDCRAPAPRP